MKEVTRETLLEKIADLELLKESGAISLHGEYNLAAYKMLLEHLEKEPIAWLNDAYLARDVVDGDAGSEDAGPGYIPAYRK